MSGSANLPLQFNRDRTERQLDARLAELLDKLRKNRPADDPWLVRRAYDIAAERHRDQLRRSGDPYMTHLLEVAHILADMKMDATTLTAALFTMLSKTRNSPSRAFKSALAKRLPGLWRVLQKSAGSTCSRLKHVRPRMFAKCSSPW